MQEDKNLAREFVPGINSFESINAGESGSRLYRIRSEGGQRVILKTTRPEDIPGYLSEQYPEIADIEYYFYREIFPALDLPGPEILESGLFRGGGNYIFFSDISESFNIPSQTKYLKRESWEKILRGYAICHSFCETYLQRKGIPSWLNPPLEERFCPGEIIKTWDELSRHFLTREIAGAITFSGAFLNLVERVKNEVLTMEKTILHNDFFPGNIGLPVSGEKRAVIIDWQLASSGPAPIDIAQMDLDWDHYWTDFYTREISRWGGEKVSRQSFEEKFFYCRLFNSAIFLPVILKAAHRNQKTRKKMTPWMLGCLEECTQQWKKALG